MAERGGTSYSQLAESLTAVKQNQDQFQQNHHALQQMVQGLAKKLDVVASHVEALVQSKAAHNTGNPGGFAQPITNPLYDNTKIITRAVRLDFPRFNGENPSGWIYRASQFFTYHQTNPLHRVLMASFHMEGKALVWFQDIEAAGGLNSWEGFIQVLQTRFGSSPYEDSMKANTSIHTATTLTPFESVSSYPFPPKLMQFIPGTTKLQKEENTLKTQDEILSVLPINRLDLPPESRIHPVGHGSCLKKKLGQRHQQVMTLTPTDKDGVVHPEPKEFVGRKMTERKGKALTELLVKWRGLGAEEASWVIYAVLAKSSLTLRARSFKGGGIVTCPYDHLKGGTLSRAVKDIVW